MIISKHVEFHENVCPFHEISKSLKKNVRVESEEFFLHVTNKILELFSRDVNKNLQNQSPNVEVVS